MSFSIGRGRYRTETYPKPSFPAGIAPDGGLGTSYVFRQGGTPAPGVFVTSAALAAAMLLVDPAAFKVVTVDTVDAPGGVAHIETGVTLPDNVLFKGGGSSALPTLTFDEGSHLAGNTYQALDIVLVNAATATPVWSPSASTGSVLNLTGSELTPAGAGAVFCDAVGPVSVTAVESSVGDATHALFAVESTGAVDWLGFDGSTIFPNTIKQGSAPGGVVNFTVDGASQRGTSVVQVPVPTVIVLDPLTSYEFAPGGTDEGVVFTTWAGFMACYGLVPDLRADLFVNDAAAAAHVTVGTWGVNNLKFSGDWDNGSTLLFDTGAVFTFEQIWLTAAIVFQNNGTGNVFTSAGAGSVMYLDGDGTNLVSAAAPAVPWAHVTVDFGLTIWTRDGGIVGDGTHNVVTIDAGMHMICFAADGSNIRAHAFGGAGTAEFAVQAGAGFSATQDCLTTVSWNTLAKQVGYAPTTGGNWNPVPTLAGPALDQLAAPNFKQSTAVVGGGTHTVTFVTAGITKAKSGIVQVNGDCSGATAAADTITVTLQRDATVLRTKTITTVATQLNYDVAMSFEDTLPDNASHTYTLSLAGAQNNTVAANGGYIGAREGS